MLKSVLIALMVTFTVFCLSCNILNKNEKVTMWSPVKVIAVLADGKTYVVNSGTDLKIEMTIKEKIETKK